MEHLLHGARLAIEDRTDVENYGGPTEVTNICKKIIIKGDLNHPLFFIHFLL